MPGLPPVKQRYQEGCIPSPAERRVLSDFNLSGNIWFFKFDANSAFHQVMISHKDRKKTAFITRYGLFKFRRMGFDLSNAPTTLSRAMNLFLRGLTWSIVLAFLDDTLALARL